MNLQFHIVSVGGFPSPVRRPTPLVETEFSRSKEVFLRLKDPDGAGTARRIAFDNFGWHSTSHVGVNTNQFRRRFYTDKISNNRTPIAACSCKSCVSKTFHQVNPGISDAFWAPTCIRSVFLKIRSPAVDGITRSNASDAVAPCSVGLVSGSIIFNCSMTDPGHPCVTISGNAFSCFERTWMK